MIKEQVEFGHYFNNFRRWRSFCVSSYSHSHTSQGTQILFQCLTSIKDVHGHKAPTQSTLCNLTAVSSVCTLNCAIFSCFDDLNIHLRFVIIFQNWKLFYVCSCKINVRVVSKFFVPHRMCMYVYLHSSTTQNGILNLPCFNILYGLIGLLSPFWAYVHTRRWNAKTNVLEHVKRCC